LGENFFVHASKVGQSRSEIVKNFLLELNPDVQGESQQKSFDSLLSSPEAFQSFSLIIACQLSFNQIASLSKISESLHIPLIVCKSVGLVGYLRIFTEEHPVIESKPDRELFDLRIHKPFEELKKYCQGVDLDSLELVYHSHVPFIVILVKLMEEWLTREPRPATFNEKQKFKEFIKARSKDFNVEDNFREAVQKSFLAYLDEDLPEEIMKVLNDEKATQADQGSSLFWKCAKAVNSFISLKGVPPVTGLFSDMTSDTSSYVKLQTIYNNKAKSDLESTSEIFQSLFPETPVPELLSDFCKNLLTLEVTRMRTISEELIEMNKAVLEDPDEVEYKLVDWYLGLRAIDHHMTSESEWPGTKDLPSLQSFTESLAKQADLEVLEEMLRYKDSELHTVSALLAGVASQEAVKLITKQYTPINNTFIYTGASSQAGVIEL
jgi:amyloid beta precursor protein binding protein 1